MEHVNKHNLCRWLVLSQKHPELNGRTDVVIESSRLDKAVNMKAYRFFEFIYQWGKVTVMNLKSLSRALLYFTFFYNLFGFVSFAFPETLGKISGLPASSQLVYSAFGAGQILLWAFVYLFLARQEHFNRPLFWVGALGKFILFTALLISWQNHENRFIRVDRLIHGRGLGDLFAPVPC